MATTLTLKKLFDLRVNKALKGTKFNHRTKSLRTYAHSRGLTPRLKEFVHRIELIRKFPVMDIAPFVVSMDNQFRNAGLANTMYKYFRVYGHPMGKTQPDLNYKFTELNFLSNANILGAHHKVKPETLDEWAVAMAKIEKYFKFNPYIPRHRKKRDKAKEVMVKLFNPNTPAKAINVNSASPSEWRKKLRTNGGEDNGK